MWLWGEAVQGVGCSMQLAQELCGQYLARKKVRAVVVFSGV